jgi:hypothetical protein
MAEPSDELVPWPTPNALYGLATHTVVEALRTLSDPMPRLHIPDYYCQEVVDTWVRYGVRVARYAHDPRWPEPEWDSVHAEPGDSVLAVNFFGVSAGEGWRRWQALRPDVFHIEDHSHDPASAWARRSTADFAFASLRKTIPISDGAILWSPRARPVPEPPLFDPENGSRTKRRAMELKREYLAGAAVDKEAFRSLQLAGEAALLASQPAAISPWSRAFVAAGVRAEWRRRRSMNVSELLAAVADSSRVRPLFSGWQADQCPFNAVLEFRAQADRDACRADLIRQHVYPPVHWTQPPDAAARVRDLATRILTIPADQRYDSSDMRRIGNMLRVFGARD